MKASIPTAPVRLMHGSDWNGEDVAGWWLSEKLNGWRCIWTGTEFLSRQGEAFAVPPWWREGMPARPLDGELWAGHGTTHDQVSGLMRSRDWRALTFRPFDIPIPGLRIEAAQEILAGLSLPMHVHPVTYSVVESTAAAFRAMLQIVAAGGEGAMLRKPNSRYWPDCPSIKFLKLKPGALEPPDLAGVLSWAENCHAGRARAGCGAL